MRQELVVTCLCPGLRRRYKAGSEVLKDSIIYSEAATGKRQGWRISILQEGRKRGQLGLDGNGRGVEQKGRGSRSGVCSREARVLLVTSGKTAFQLTVPCLNEHSLQTLTHQGDS